LFINEYNKNSHYGGEKMNNIQKFVNVVQTKFKKYVLAYGTRESKDKTIVQFVIDDRDIKLMSKRELIRKLDVMINNMLFELLAKQKSKKNIEAEISLLSDLNQNTIWQALGDTATVLDTKAVANFIKINLPDSFFQAYDALSAKFKLDDFRKEFTKITKKSYHRNTYQNWLRELQDIGFIKLAGKFYIKVFRANTSAMKNFV
jgi:hypothetical protein